MLDFFDNLCGCFSPEIKRNIIDYLSSANLNRNLMEEEKTNEDIEAPSDSIYSHVKTKSYYFMKLQQDEEADKDTTQKEQHGGNNRDRPLQSPQEECQNAEEVNWYSTVPGIEGVDEVYKNKLQVLRTLLAQETGPEFSKVYDSQDQTNLKIFCKPQIYQSKRFNAYKFSFKVPPKPSKPVTPADYLSLSAPQHDLNHLEPLLSSAVHVDESEGGVQVIQKRYKKVLVIGQHEFYLGSKAEIIEEEGRNVVYDTLFSVRGDWDKVPDYCRGWVNLAGLRLSVEREKVEEAESTSLSEEQEQERGEEYLSVEGYINCQLEISVNANMLKQPIAKQIRVFVQKLVASLKAD